ncbi:hypothetical protein [Burkholderia stagnalis]|uniref:hypothetical protein n=1 Tax=Burkholderia stagnalis TaxID=1503054 RepID=UPI000F80DE37|nr:hypothetical protein [Burkholderia stagnalis]
MALPEKSMESGGFYWQLERLDVAQNIYRNFPGVAISEADRKKERQISCDVTHDIIGGYADWERRLALTRSAKELISES